MKALAITHAKHGQTTRWTATVQTPAAHQDLWFEIPSQLPDPPNPADAFACALLLPSMVAGSTLSLPAPISPRLRANLNGIIQDIYRCWDRSTKRIEIECPDNPAPSATSTTGSGVFFSGGVDSLYSFDKHESEITHLITVHGFDIDIDDTALWDETITRLTETAKTLNRELVPIRTNVRRITDQFAGWSINHGGPLAAISHLLSATISKAYIGSTHTYADLFPWGSHPVLDHHWSTERTEIIHDGCEANRVEKVKRIAKHPEALKHLRVCWQNLDSAYNCGRCEKCIRTMINLTAVGAGDHLQAFSGTGLTPAKIRNLNVESDNNLAFLKENLEELEANNTAPHIQAALRQAMNRRGKFSLKRALRRSPLRTIAKKALGK